MGTDDDRSAQYAAGYDKLAARLAGNVEAMKEAGLWPETPEQTLDPEDRRKLAELWEAYQAKAQTQQALDITHHYSPVVQFIEIDGMAVAIAAIRAWQYIGPAQSKSGEPVLLLYLTIRGLLTVQGAKARTVHEWLAAQQGRTFRPPDTDEGTVDFIAGGGY